MPVLSMSERPRAVAAVLSTSPIPASSIPHFPIATIFLHLLAGQRTTIFDVSDAEHVLQPIVDARASLGVEKTAFNHSIGL